MGGVVINTCVWRHFLTPSDRGLYERYHAKSEEGPPFDTSNRAIAGSQVHLATPLFPPVPTIQVIASSFAWLFS